jgi:hypothetical protein
MPDSLDPAHVRQQATFHHVVKLIPLNPTLGHRMARNYNFRTEEITPYATAIGELALIWNDLHMVLSSIFWKATRIPNGMIADAMWNSLKSDRAQREMLESIINLDAMGQLIKGATREELIWALTEITKLEDLRNNALHSPMLIESDGSISPWHQTGNKRAKNLAKRELLSELRRFYDTAIIIRDYVEALRNAMVSQDDLPARPTLPSINGDARA